MTLLDSWSRGGMLFSGEVHWSLGQEGFFSIQIARDSNYNNTTVEGDKDMMS